MEHKSTAATTTLMTMVMDKRMPSMIITLPIMAISMAMRTPYPRTASIFAWGSPWPSIWYL